MSYNINDAGDKLATKIIIGYGDGTSDTVYVKGDKVQDTLIGYLGKRSVVYLVTHDRPIRKNYPVVISDRTAGVIKELEVLATPYIDRITRNEARAGIRMSSEEKDAQVDFEAIKAIRKLMGWTPPERVSIKDYYGRREHE